MIASDIMTAPAESIRPDATIDEAIATLLSARVSGLTVTDEHGLLVGVVSESDFLHRAEIGTAKRRPRWLEFLLGPGEIAEAYVQSHGRKVSELMTRDVVTVSESTTLTEIVELMEKRRVKRLPVVNGDLLVGIVTRADLLRAIRTAVASRTAGADRSDQTILTQLLAELNSQGFVSPKCLNVTVDKGSVTLTGEIFDERQRPAMIVAAENISGVVKVVDKLVWVEPFSGLTIEHPDAL
jgi:CBS domain-containing protein